MKSPNGWVKIHRQILEWEWFDDQNTFRLFIYLLLKANHKDKRYKGKLVKRGSLLTGRELLSKETGLSTMQVRTSLTKLKSTNEITINSTKQGTEIQVVNYDNYQVVTNEITNEQPTNNQRVTTNKNEKKEKKYREIENLSLSQDEFIRLLERGYTKQQVDIILDKIERYDKRGKYSDLYKVCLTWLSKEGNHKQQKEEVDPMVSFMLKHSEENG